MIPSKKTLMVFVTGLALVVGGCSGIKGGSTTGGGTEAARAAEARAGAADRLPSVAPSSVWPEQVWFLRTTGIPPPT